MNRLRQLWGDLRSSFWFTPSLIVVTSILFAGALIEADSAWSDQWLARWPRMFGAGAEGARQLLSTLAGSMMTVMGITFSMTLLALALASSQYTSRILRNFMRNRVTQVTLGTFAGIFVYCLIVLRTIRGGEAEFVPSTAVFFAFFMAVGGVGVLIFFIHHIASSIQASTIIASVAQETLSAIERQFPQESALEPDEQAARGDPLLRSADQRSWYPVPADLSGYIQSVDHDVLLGLAREWRTVVRMERGIGAFVVRDTALVSLALTFPPCHAMIAALNGAYSIGRHRTIEQDPAFGIRQIVDVALKALSPGINDTSTAVMCVDYLSAVLARLSCRQLPPSRCYDGETLRVITIAPTFEGMLSAAFDPIRRGAEGNVAIMERVLGAVETIAGLTLDPRHHRALDEQVERIAELADRTIGSAHDRAQIESRVAHARKALETEPAMRPEKARA
ncbi:DUF2254 domain-containing protein [Endothiovibrio diazotrophicus]